MWADPDAKGMWHVGEGCDRSGEVAGNETKEMARRKNKEETKAEAL